jgi:large subunit ribosomal protein L25
MAAPIKLEGSERTQFGKGAARRMRVAGNVPASVYAGGKKPLFLQIPALELRNALRHTNAVYELTFGKEDHLAVVKDVQRNPLKQTIEHVDFYEVKKGEKIEITVPVFITGETKGNGVAFIDIQELRVRADVSELPERFTLSVDGMQAGDRIEAKDVKLPKGAELLDIAPTASVVSVQIPSEEVPDTPAAGAAATAPAAGATAPAEGAAAPAAGAGDAAKAPAAGAKASK